jgi:hypothetical protein
MTKNWIEKRKFRILIKLYVGGNKFNHLKLEKTEKHQENEVNDEELNWKEEI